MVLENQNMIDYEFLTKIALIWYQNFPLIKIDIIIVYNVFAICCLSLDYWKQKVSLIILNQIVNKVIYQ